MHMRNKAKCRFPSTLLFTRVLRLLRNSDNVQGATCTCYAHACALPFLLMIHAKHAGTLPSFDPHMTFFYTAVDTRQDFRASMTCNMRKYNITGDVTIFLLVFFFGHTLKW